MTRLGKFDPALLQEFVYPHLGIRRSDVIVGPSFGVDNAVVKTGEGRVMALTTDPISWIPALGPTDSAWLSSHNLASDLTTSGFPPAYALFDFNLPPTVGNREFRAYWMSLQHEFGKLGTMIIGGHTGRFEGCDFTVIGGGTLIAVGEEDAYLSSNMAQVGDSLIVTKSAALSSAALLSRIFPQTIEDELGSRTLRRVQKLFHSISTVKDALTLAGLNANGTRISAMHDTTEGGVFAALYEMLAASRVGGIIEQTHIPIAEDVNDVCKLFSLDPYSSLSEGSLIVSVSTDKVEDAVRALSQVGVASVVVGRVVKKAQGIKLQRTDGLIPLRYPETDPYWVAYWKGVHQGWK